jgi:hypothetical protein
METKKTLTAPTPIRVLTEKQQKEAIGYLDDANIAALKAQKSVKSIHEVFTIDDDEQEHVTYFTKPTLDHLQVLADYAKKDKEMEGLATLFNTCRVAGSPDVLTDDEMKASAYKALAQLFKRREAVVKKR